ncbi:hypothetical protein PHET_09754 [Paragonimus heterotremus]|uniref:Uncharacterized protein n=1 Tax=Paragonimus heterotremus TaxID=100268 RepID=A0A8J4T9S1_9TREM|nr:hypothetical protein PHET_09754 [Paragonimus heterotremus]
MIAIPFMVVILMLVNDASGESGISSKTITSIFKGKLYHNLKPVEAPQNLSQTELDGLIQRDVCEQITSTVPWYRSQRDTSRCMVDVENDGHISVTYTISATDEFLKSHDPSCSSYDILLDRLVQRNKPSGNGYYLKEMKLETVMTLYGSLLRSGKRPQLNGHISLEESVKEANENVKKQIVQFLGISSTYENHIRVQNLGFRIMQMPKPYIMARANITIGKVMLIENRINATCRSFIPLIETCLKSPFNGHNTIHYGIPANIFGVTTDSDTSV